MKKRFKIGLMAAVLAGSASMNAFGGAWVGQGSQWRYQLDNGQYAVRQWVADGGYYYYTDEAGNMKTGWYQDPADSQWYYLQPNAGAPQGSMKTGWLLENGRWYFLDTRAGGPMGSMKVGWQWIDGKCYYLDPVQGGALAVNTITPDGYRVNENGAWVNEAGQEYVEAGRGIPSAVQAGPGGGSAASGTASNPGGGLSGGGSGGGSGSGGSGGGSSSSGSSSGRSDSRWEGYSDSSVSHSANDFTTGNWGQMSSDERLDVNDAIEAFKDEYITEGMSDFEKELLIIQWLVENCTYEAAEGWSNATAYSCIVSGEAQCAGYADAFLQTAKACGLEARYIHNSEHAWNLVKLDGDWYHVDVTWEDPIGDNDYGMGNLRNLYINLTDSEIREVRSHTTWSPDSTKAKGTKYNAFVVREYMENGTLNMDAAQEAEEEYNQIFEDMRDPEHNNIFDYSSVKKTSAEIIDYLGAVIEKGALSYQFAVRFPGYNPNNIDDSLEVYDISDEIEEAVNSEINDKYADVLQKEFRCYLFSSEDGYRKSYSIVRGALSYQEGQGASVPYTIHFVDNETEEEVGAQTGEGEPWREIDFEFPEYYSWISNRSYTVNVGSARNDSGRAFTITSLNPVDMTVQVRLKQIPCQITYVNDDTDEVVGTWEGMVIRGDRNEFEFPEGKWVVRELEVISGEAKLRGGDFEIEGREPVEMVVRIH